MRIGGNGCDRQSFDTNSTVALLRDPDKYLVLDRFSSVESRGLFYGFAQVRRIEEVLNFLLERRFDNNALPQPQLLADSIEGLDKIEERKEQYKATGIPYYRPWLFIITDGLPEGEDPATLQEAQSRLKRVQERKGVVVYAVGVGGVDLDVIGEITGTPPLALKGANFAELFTWLSKSLESVSRSKPGAQITLPDPHWATMQTA